MDYREQAAVEAAEAAIQEQEVKLARMRKGLALLRGSEGEPEERSTEWADMGIIEAAGLWLQEMGEPQNTRAIADALRQRGVQTTSNNFVNTIGNTLRNDKVTFKRTDQGQWDLVSRKKKKR